MNKTISLDFRFRKINKDTAIFTENFLQDLGKCLNRFKMDAALLEKTSLTTESFVLIFLSEQDFDDKQFVSESIALADAPNTFLINITPLKTIEREFPLHKYKLFRFWEEIKETGEIRLFRRNSSENNALYWERITDITITIAERYSTSKELKKGKIFLAQSDNSQASDRDNLSRDLTEMGYEVLPDRLLNQDFSECTEQVKQYLRGCNLIIHPIPLVYSKYFGDKQISLIEHQCVLSSQFITTDKSLNIKRIIWIPSDFEISDEENQIFVEKIQRDLDQSSNTMVLKVTLEELKKIYRKILSGEEVSIVENNLPDIYVVADNDDKKINEKLVSSEGGSGMAVKTNYKGITYNQHLKYLANSQVVVINYTSENEPWFTMKVNDIFKSKGMNSSKPFKKVILVKENKDLNTSAFESRFSEIHICSLEDLKLNLAVKNN